ncbi:MAG: polyhydroxyalkanoate synthesis repressor PhaR [Limnohabitans sp.]
MAGAHRRKAPVATASSRTPAADNEPAIRTIKKYPNRRLYDALSSRYVTLAEIRQLVMQGEPFVVRDAKTSEDLTRSILLQIILEQEAAGVPLLSESALANLIRFYGHALQPLMGRSLEQQLQAMTDWQRELGGAAQSLQGPAFQALMSDYVAQSSHAMTQIQLQMQRQAEQLLGAFGLKI